MASLRWPGTAPLGLLGFGVPDTASSAQWMHQPPIQQQQVAALLVNLNHVLQAVAPGLPPAAAAIPAVQEAVNAYAIGAFTQSFQLAQAAAAYLDGLAAQGRQSTVRVGGQPGS